MKKSQMIKHFYKGIIVMGIMCCGAFSARAQMGFDYAQYDLGLAVNANQVYGDAEKVKVTPSATFNFTYNATPFVNYVFEIGAGTLKAGDALKSLSGREFKNNYTSFVARGQLQAGELIDYSQSQIYNALKNLYASAGVGLVSNNIKSISRTSNFVQGFYTPGKDQSQEFFIPVRLGYELKIFDAYNMPSVKIDLAYQVNFMMGENLDGFDAGSRKDIWNQLVLGVKIGIGGGTSYRKPVSFY